MSRNKTLRCSECECGLGPMYDERWYYNVDGERLCEGCFIEHVKFAVEENPERFAELLNVARVGVTN